MNEYDRERGSMGTPVRCSCPLSASCVLSELGLQCCQHTARTSQSTCVSPGPWPHVGTGGCLQHRAGQSSLFLAAVHFAFRLDCREQRFLLGLSRALGCSFPHHFPSFLSHLGNSVVAFGPCGSTGTSSRGISVQVACQCGDSGNQSSLCVLTYTKEAERSPPMTSALPLIPLGQYAVCSLL